MGDVKFLRVCVVIVNWNRRELTRECLNLVGKLDREGVELSIIVVDNGSTDGSVRAIRNAKRKRQNAKVEVIGNSENLGYAAGNNVGIKRALAEGADYVLVMNNDIVPREDLVVRLVGEMEKNADWGLVSPKIYFARGFEFHKSRYKKESLGKVIWYAGGKIDWENVLASHVGVDEVDKGQFERARETGFASGSCMLVRGEVFSQVGVFDEQFFMYWEDVDLAMRAKGVGWKVVYSPETCVWHKVSASSAIGSGLNDYFITRNRMKFGLKYAPLRSKLAMVRESLKLLCSGREWQKQGIKDFYLGRMEKGSWK